MSIPKFNDLFDDVLEVLISGSEMHRKDMRARVIERLHLTEAELDEKLSGGNSRIGSRVHWAAEYLTQAGAISRPRRGYMQITELGRAIYAEGNGNVTLTQLRSTDGLKAWRERTIESKAHRKGESSVNSDDSTLDMGDSSPMEGIDDAVRLINTSLKDELLQRVREERPEFLEKLVLMLLHQMGYGASPDDLVHTGTSGDEGIDGVIHQDQLGIDKIYVQAKRYRETGSIGRPAIQAFVGALAGKNATRGVFITTSYFSRDAIEFVDRSIGFSVVLIDGEKLASLMVQNRVGVTVRQTIELLGIDENFFTED